MTVVNLKNSMGTENNSMPNEENETITESKGDESNDQEWETRGKSASANIPIAKLLVLI